MPTKRKYTYRDLLLAKKRANRDVRRIRFRRTTTTTTNRIPGRYVRRRRRAAAPTSSVQSLTRHMEQKYITMGRVNEAAPSSIQALAQVYSHTTILGSGLPIGWTGTYTPIGGVRIPQGDSNIERDGNVVYLQSTTLRYIIDMKQFDINSSDQTKLPHQFRVIVFKSKLKYLAGGTHDPGKNLFLNETNVPFGPQDSGVNGMDLMTFPCNRRDFIVRRDFKFTLAPSQVNAFNRGSNSSGSDASQFLIGSNPKYPSQKVMTIYLPHNKKATYDNTTLEPVDYNPAWAVMVLARVQGQDHFADDWEVNVRGSTKFKDI